MAASSSAENKGSITVEKMAMQYYLYPPPVARYEDVIASPDLFMDTLGRFHAAVGTKFMIPIVGGKDLDLHRLFVEVTARGGIKRVLKEKKWKEVINSFSFPPSATNASFILRKYYMSLIHHFEQVYYFKAKAWTPVSTDTWQTAPVKQQRSSSAEIEVALVKRQRTTTEASWPKAFPEPAAGFPVTGIIDGKFESGYLCTVMIGGERLQGVLYQSIGHPLYQIPKHPVVAAPASMMGRRRRRKKSEMKKRDPARPKPNRSGYNFFFAEQHARLKPLHPGKDRDISRMIGELWNNLTESKKAVYQETAMKDKERYRIEMERYRERLRTGQLVDKMEFDETPETGGGGTPQTPENELASACSDRNSFKGEAGATDKDSDHGLPLPVETGAQTADVPTVSGGPTKTWVGAGERPKDVEMDPKDDHEGRTRHDKPTMRERLNPVELDGPVKLERLMAEARVEYEPEPLNPKEPVVIDENLGQEPDGFIEGRGSVVND